MQYDSYKRTVDQVRTRYGGSEALPRTPTQADPRSVVPQSRLEEDPRLKTMWAGYAFAKEFREERGHTYMLDDQTVTQRQAVVRQPATCLHCHAFVYVPYSRGLRSGSRTRGPGTCADDILAYYEESGFSDWTHAETGAPMLKAQHPEFEIWTQGVDRHPFQVRWPRPAPALYGPRAKGMLR
jgi:formate-dependent nitrite reductase cytochrome c552 subunit